MADGMAKWEDELDCIALMIERSEQAQQKFAAGTSQHTLQRNRIHALRVAEALIGGERADIDRYSRQDMERARVPLASLICKSEKAQQKLKPGTWQYKMLEGNLQALHLAERLLAAELE